MTGPTYWPDEPRHGPPHPDEAAWRREMTPGLDETHGGGGPTKGTRPTPMAVRVAAGILFVWAIANAVGVVLVWAIGP